MHSVVILKLSFPPKHSLVCDIPYTCESDISAEEPSNCHHNKSELKILSSQSMFAESLSVSIISAHSH